MTLSDRSALFPVGAAINLNTLSADPYPAFARLHAAEPISWVPEIQMWVVSRRANVQQILSDPETFTVVSAQSILRRILGRNMLTTDGAEQQRLRQPFVKPLASKTVREQMSEQVQAQVHKLIDEFVAEGEGELMTQFSDPLALTVVTTALGLPIHDYTAFRGWYHSFNAALGNFTHDPSIEQNGLMAKTAFADYVRDQLNRLRREPDNSLLSQLALHSALDEDEIIDDVRVTIFGGLETTSALLGNCLWALLTHPQAFAVVTAEPSSQINAIEEAFRWESPVQTATRHVTRTVNIHGVQLQAGETLQCLLGAANRDPAYFPKPDDFDIVRPNAKDHLAFGTGKHFCIGASLARLETQIGLRTLLVRLPHLRLTRAEDRPTGHEFRAPGRLRIAWEPQPL